MATRSSTDAVRDPFDLSGRVAVVTGGTRGLGLALARGLRRAGAGVSAWARTVEPAQEMLEDLGIQAVRCDVTSSADIDRAMAATVARYGRLDVFVANAGHGAEMRPYLEVDEALWREVIDTNLTGVFLGTRAAARHMRDAGHGGKIVVISSIRAATGTTFGPAYAASKAGVEALVRTMAATFAPDIQVNAIRPGWFGTDMTRWLTEDPSTRARIGTAVPAGRMGRPDELVGLVVYLASGASDYHTGDTITIDGGCLARDPLTMP